MWNIFAIVFPVMLLIIVAMAVGPLFGRAPIKGSCGGLNVSGQCDICGGDPNACEEPAATPRTALFDDLAEPASFDPMAEPRRRRP